MKGKTLHYRLVLYLPSKVEYSTTPTFRAFPKMIFFSSLQPPYVLHVDVPSIWAGLSNDNEEMGILYRTYRRHRSINQVNSA